MKHLEIGIKLTKVLWAFRINKKKSTGTSPYELSYRQEAILPTEITVKTVKEC